MPNLEDISYTSKADIMVVKRNLDLLNAGAVWDATHSGNNLTVTGAPEVPYTLRFVATGKYLPENGLKINNTIYTAQMPNGKPLPSGAWDTGAVVLLQIDPNGKKAFFSGGGADLSFITAGAEQILAGYVGANADGEPVEGALNPPKVYIWTSNNVNTKTILTPDFAPDILAVMEYQAYEISSGTVYEQARYTCVDYKSQEAFSASGPQNYYASVADFNNGSKPTGASSLSGLVYTSKYKQKYGSSTTYQPLDFGRHPYYNLPLNSTVPIIGQTAYTSIKKSIRVVAIKF